jgi:hypothetical protein
LDDKAARACWDREQAHLGLAPGTPDEAFAAGGLASFAVPPTVRICVLVGDSYAVAVPPQNPGTVIPQPIIVPCGRELSHHGIVRGMSSGYVAVSSSGEDGLWRSFAAVHWHGGVDFFLGDQGGSEWAYPAGFQRRVVYLQKAVGWAWAAFALQREMVERFGVGGPFRAIVAVAQTSGASLVAFGAGWPEASSTGFWGQPMAVDRRVAVFGDHPVFDPQQGVQEPVVQGTTLLIAQADAQITLDEQGNVRVSRPARGSDRNLRAMGGLPSLIEEEVRDRVADGIRYAGWLLNRVDPTNRLRRVGLACRLAGIGYLPWRTRAEAAQSPNSASMGSGLEVADSPPALLARAALLFNNTRLADDITVRLRRQVR